MSTVAEEVTPEDGNPECKKKTFYCKMCNIMCLSFINLQSHYHGAKHRKRQAVLKYKAMCLKRKLMKDVTCLKDFINHPKRQEPLVGLQYVVEFRYEGRINPRYECKLCGVQTPMVPMMEHLSGYKHRRAYISKEYPDKIKTVTADGKEYFLVKQIAEELEKTEGLKMYKTETYMRSRKSRPSKEQESLEDDFKHENDPVRKQKALEFLETFHITSDSEATLVVHITQELTEALKAFCEKKAGVNYTDSLTPPMSAPQDEFPGEESIPEHYEPPMSAPQDEFPGEESIPEHYEPPMSAPQDEFPGEESIPEHYEPYEKSEENSDWSQEFLSQYEECSEDTSLVPDNSYSYQTDDGSASYGLQSNEFATMSTPGDSFALQTESPANGINEQLRQFSPSASGGNSAGGAPSYETSTVNEYSAEYMSNNVQGTELPDGRVGYSGEITNWKDPQACARSISDQGLPYSNSPALYPLSGGYSTNYSSQSYSAYSSGSVNTCTFSVNSAVPGTGDSSWSQGSSWNQKASWNQESSWNQETCWNQESWHEEFRHQKSDYRSNWASHQYSFTGSGSYSTDYQQFRSSEMLDQNAVGLTPSVVNRLHRMDIPTVTGMHKAFTPYYPARQRVNIRTLVNVLVETREEN